MVEDFWEIIKENIWGMICKKVVELYGKLKSEFHDQFSHLIKVQSQALWPGLPLGCLHDSPVWENGFWA